MYLPHLCLGLMMAQLRHQPASCCTSPCPVWVGLLQEKRRPLLKSCTAFVQVESARKLRWYDREDLRPLVEANLRDKQLLNETITALRQACHLILH